MPKRISWSRIIIVFCVIGYIVWMVDITLAIPFDLFDIGVKGKQGLPELTLCGIIPSSISVIYVNYYKEEQRWGYVAVFTTISFILEWLTVQVGLMKLIAWSTYWSLPVHFGAYAYLLPWLLQLELPLTRARN